VIPPVRFRRLPHGLGIDAPLYATSGAAGADLSAAVQADGGILLLSMQRALVPTGLALQIPEGYEAQVRPRSGLAARHGITVLNAPGTIDSDYRGEVMVLLVNLGGEAFRIERGMRIAQLVIAPVIQMRLEEVDALDDSMRGEGGFGSTGIGAAGVVKRQG
jgi:dUTP pyrophosphatase